MDWTYGLWTLAPTDIILLLTIFVKKNYNLNQIITKVIATEIIATTLITSQFKKMVTKKIKSK